MLHSILHCPKVRLYFLYYILCVLTFSGILHWQSCSDYVEAQMSLKLRVKVKFCFR